MRKAHTMVALSVQAQQLFKITITVTTASFQEKTPSARAWAFTT
jgi:hypothetical protein